MKIYKFCSSFNSKIVFYLLCTCVILNVQGLIAQDVHFSQYDETRLQLNPASAGVGADIRVVTNYKSQWQSLGNGYKTIALSGDTKLFKRKSNHLGVGFDFYNDQAGEANMSITQGNLSLSGIINLNKQSLISTGIAVGFSQRSLSPSNLTFGNQYDGNIYNSNLSNGENFMNTSFSLFDAGAGVQYSYGIDQMYLTANNVRKLNVGLSVLHLNKPTNSFSSFYTDPMKMKVVFNGDGSIGIKNANLVIKPSFLVLIQGKSKEITTGASCQYILKEGSRRTSNVQSSAVSLGAYMRLKDAFIAVAKYEYSNFSVGLSYDVNFSSLRTVSKTKGGFELSLRFMTPSSFGRSISRSRI